MEVTIPDTSNRGAEEGRVAPSGLAWSVLLDGPLGAARNMARDHALALSLRADSAVLRLYRWERPTLSLGRNEPALGRYRQDAIERTGLDVVRRPTGGRAVVHWRELTYAVALPVRALGSPRAAYHWINGRIATALASLGTAVEIAPAPPRELPPSSGPCFAEPAGGEVVAKGRKLVGSAQLRVQDGLLQHGSILLADDQMLLAEVQTGERSRTVAPATVSELLGRDVGIEEIEDAVMLAFGLGRSCIMERSPASPLESRLEEHYRSRAWTWRR